MKIDVINKRKRHACLSQELAASRELQKSASAGCTHKTNNNKIQFSLNIWVGVFFYLLLRSKCINQYKWLIDDHIIYKE